MKTRTTTTTTDTLSKALREADLSPREYTYMVHWAIGSASVYEETRSYHKAAARDARAFARYLTRGLDTVLADRAKRSAFASEEPPL